MNRFSVLFVLFALGCSSLTTVPELGDKLILSQNFDLLMVASGQTWPHQEMKLDGVTYDIATNDRHRVAYISTRDPKFRTPEGLSVGSTLQQVLLAGAKQPWGELGWAYHTELPSGWSAAFTVGRGMTDGPLQPEFKICWFFKRK